MRSEVELKAAADPFAAMTREVAALVEAKGFRDDRTFGDECMLLVTEVAEAVEAYRKHGFERWYVNMHGERVVLDPDGPAHYDSYTYKPEGVASEFADVLIRLLDDCHRHGVDLFAEYQAKMAYNWTRSYRHGDKNL